MKTPAPFPEFVSRPDAERTADARVRSNLGIPQPTYTIQNIGDLFDIPEDRRVVACQALARWLVDPNTTVPKPPWFHIRYWLGGQFAEFVWQDDGRVLSDPAHALNVDIDAAKAESETKCREAISGLAREFGLHMVPDQDGDRVYRASVRVGAPAEAGLEVETRMPATYTVEQEYAHLSQWLRQEGSKLETVSTMRRRLRHDYKITIEAYPIRSSGKKPLADYFLRTDYGGRLKLQPLTEYAALVEALNWARNPANLATAILQRSTDNPADPRTDPLAWDEENTPSLADMERMYMHGWAKGAAGEYVAPPGLENPVVNCGYNHGASSRITARNLSHLSIKGALNRNVPADGVVPGPGKVASTVKDEDRVAHWMLCTKHWDFTMTAPPYGIVTFHKGEAIELLGADFARGRATLVWCSVEVSIADLLEHARVMNPEELPVREALQQKEAPVPLQAQPLPETALQSLEDVEEVEPMILPRAEHVPATEPPADTRGHEAMEALEKANPTAPGLVGKDAPRRYVFLSDVLGQFARYAVEQSPYLHPDGLLEVLDAIKGDIQDRFHPTLRWCELNFREVEAMLNEAIMALPQVSAWNQRKNGNTSEFAFTSAYEGKPDPDNDFIDLQALITNVALACTRPEHHGDAPVVSAQQPPQPSGDSIGLWRYHGGQTKFLVLRRDGSIPTWPWFVLGARDMAAVQAMAAYAWYASLLGYPPQFVADCERLAREMADFRHHNGAGDPAAPPSPEQPDHPAIITLMQAHARGESARIQDAPNWGFGV